MKVLGGVNFSRLISSTDLVIQFCLFNLFMSYIGQIQNFCFPKFNQSWTSTYVVCIKRGITLMQEVNIYLHMPDSFD